MLDLSLVAFGVTVAAGKVESSMAIKYTVVSLISSQRVGARQDTALVALRSGTIQQWNGGLVLAE